MGSSDGTHFRCSGAHLKVVNCNVYKWLIILQFTILWHFANFISLYFSCRPCAFVSLYVGETIFIIINRGINNGTGQWQLQHYLTCIIFVRVKIRLNFSYSSYNFNWRKWTYYDSSGTLSHTTNLADFFCFYRHCSLTVASVVNIVRRSNYGGNALHHPQLLWRFCDSGDVIQEGLAVASIARDDPSPQQPQHRRRPYLLGIVRQCPSVCDRSALGRDACREHSGCASQRSWSHHYISRK